MLRPREVLPTPGGPTKQMMEPAAFPQKAVISAGTVTGPITALNNFGIENGSLILSDTPLPEANPDALKALAEMVFS